VSLRATIRTRIQRAIARKRLTYVQVAQRAGLHPRTVQRLVEGETLNWETVEAIEGALRVELVDVVEHDSHVGNRVNPLGAPKPRPVMGWRQAAQVLGMSVWTLWSRRKAKGDDSEAWWRSEDACRDWYERMMEG